MKFSINPQIFEKWPSTKLGVVLVFGMDNSKQNDEMLTLMQNQAEKSKEFAGQDLKTLPFISCWREAYRLFGASPKKYPSSIEALLERTSKGGKLPNINSLVNLYNFLSLKYLLPFGGEDLDEIRGDVELTFAKGDEKGKYIGSDKEDTALPGEVIYKDDAGFICRRWNWREADRTKFTESTKNAVLVAEIISPEFEKKLQDSIHELEKLMEKHLGGKIKIVFLDKNNPSVEFDFVGRSKVEKVEKSGEVVEKKIRQKEPEKKIFSPLKNSFAEKLQDVVWEAVQNLTKEEAGGHGEPPLQKNEIFLEHPEVENFGDYSCNVAMRLASQKQKGNFLENINWFWENLTSGNFRESEIFLPIGQFSREIAKNFGIQEKKVWLRGITYAKIRGWRQKEGFEGHEEIDKSYFYAIPYVLFAPQHILPSKENDRFLFVGKLDKQFSLCVEIGVLEKKNWLVSAFISRERFLKKHEIDCLKHKKMGQPAGTAVSPILVPKPVTIQGGGSRFSTLQDAQVFYTKFEANCQEKILEYEIKKNPMEIAQKIKEKILNQYDSKTVGQYDSEKENYIEKVEVKSPGFINFWLKKEVLFEILQKDFKFEKTGKKVMVEYSAPNPNKPLHLGHARNNALGMAMGGILKYLGNDVIYANWINNRGVAICKAMWGYLQTQKSKIKNQKADWKELLNQWAENSSDWPPPEKKTDHFVMDFYVEAEKAEKENENVKQEFLEMLNAWEAGEEKVRKLWEIIVNWAYQGWKETYQKQKCIFDKWYFESDFYQEGKEIIQKKLDEGLFYKDENGTIKVRLEKYHLPDKVLIRSDGTSIYITPDLALAKHKFADFNLDKSIYVVGCDQELYFKQLFAILDLLGFASVSQCYHLAYGMVNLTTGKMSTREGTVVLLDDVITDLTKKLQAKNEDEKISEQVAIAAINYMMLKSGTRQEMAFDPDKSVEIEGNTGPYLQYTFVRTRSVMEKIRSLSSVIPAQAGIQNGSPTANLDSRLRGNDQEEKKNFNNVTIPHQNKFGAGQVPQYNNEELSLLRTLYKFPEVVQAAAQNYAPNLICNFLYDLAQKFNNFYAKHRIIEGEQVNEFRLFLTQKTGAVLKRGMEILNLPVVEKM